MLSLEYLRILKKWQCQLNNKEQFQTRRYQQVCQEELRKYIRSESCILFQSLPTYFVVLLVTFKSLFILYYIFIVYMHYLLKCIDQQISYIV